MKTIFITGASSGIGRESAIYFSNKGWRVIATMRNPAKAGELAERSNIAIMPLDVSSPAQIRENCVKALSEYDVDVLFNNAGYGLMAPFEKIPEEALRLLFDTDVIGTMLLTQQFIPHFKRRKAGTILTTTSLAAVIALPRDGAYGAAKRAQQGMVESLYYELKPFGVKVAALIPGGTKTNFQTPLNDRTGYEEPAERQRRYLLDGDNEFPGPEEAAETVWNAVNDGLDQVNYPADHICRKLYAEYTGMAYEEFKKKFYRRLFE
ncbi:MAG: SDR family NAD(P)-dependent oxidoreductase [Lentisphaeria bacterium]|nr:SDR family NAD(P)-dependent oxidoreductase [Lentisphaeria bacterium]